VELKEFLKPNWRKILLFLLPIIFLTLTYVVLWLTKYNELIDDNLINYIIFHFPCFIETKLFCNNTNCCFTSTMTQVVSSLIFYVPWFLFSWFIVWANEKVELRGYLWRKMQEIEMPSKETKPVEKKEELPVDDELIKKKQLIKEEEEILKQEKEKLYQNIDDVNIRKLLEIGFDIKQNKIRCSNCINWDPVNNKNLAKMIKKHGIDILWNYKCKNCKKKKFSM